MAVTSLLSWFCSALLKNREAKAIVNAPGMRTLVFVSSVFESLNAFSHVFVHLKDTYILAKQRTKKMFALRIDWQYIFGKVY